MAAFHKCSFGAIPVQLCQSSYQRWAPGGSWPPRPRVVPGRWRLGCSGLSRPAAADWGSTRCTCCPCCERSEPRARLPSPPSPRSYAAAAGSTLYSHLGWTEIEGVSIRTTSLLVSGWCSQKTVASDCCWFQICSSWNGETAPSPVG